MLIDTKHTPEPLNGISCRQKFATKQSHVTRLLDLNWNMKVMRVLIELACVMCVSLSV